MIAELTQWILSALQAHGALAVFIGVLVESVIVPIPSPLIIMGAGAILITPGLGPGAALESILLRVVLPGAAASTIGAYFAFAIAYWGGKPLIDRYSPWLGFGWADILQLEARLVKRTGLMIFLLRAVPIVPLSLISAAAGVLRLPVPQFTLWTFLGSLPRCLILGCLGYLLRGSYEGLAGHLNRLESIVSAMIVAAAFGLILWGRARLRRPTAAP